MNSNPVLFYFWVHNRPEQLRTETFERLVDRSHTLFLEHVGEDEAFNKRLEYDLNDCSFNGNLSPFLAGGMSHNDVLDVIVTLTHKKSKRYVLESSKIPPFDYEKEDAETQDAFFDRGFDEACKIREDFMRRVMIYNRKREADAREKIFSIPETTLVLFGAAHDELALGVSAHRPIEVHYPYEDYTKYFYMKFSNQFDRTGSFNAESYPRELMNAMARWALDKNDFSWEETDKISRFYAGLLTVPQILEYKDYLISCSRLALPSYRSVLESYLKMNSLPLPDEVARNLSKQFTN